MPKDVEQTEGRVDSAVAGLTNLIWPSPEKRNRQASKSVVEPIETESPLNVLNQEALRNAPETPTASPKPNEKRSLLMGKRAQTMRTTSTIAKETSKQNGRSPTGMNERARGNAIIPTRTSPRGKKRPREAGDDNAMPGMATKVDVRNQASGDPRDQLRKRRKGATANPGDVQSQGAQRVSHAEKGSPQQPGERSHHLRVQVPEPSGRQLRRPRKIYATAKFRTKPQGEEAYNYNSDSGPEQQKSLPPLSSASQRGQRKAKKRIEEVAVQNKTAASKGSAAESGGFKKVTPKKRGRPRRPVGGSSKQEPLPDSPTKELEHDNQESDQITDASSRHNSPSESSAVSNEADTDEEPEDAEAEEVDIGYAPDSAFLGAHNTWNEIAEAARDNRIDEDEDSANGDAHSLANHSTKAIRDFSRTVQNASRQYKNLIKGKGDEEADQGINDKLSELINKIESQIADIREFDIQANGEKTARDKGKETIKDIYRRGVPDMVDLLNTAIICRSLDPPESYTFKGIEEIVCLLDLTISLCQKAAWWKAKPLDSGKPVIKNIRSIVFPALRGRIKKVFDAEKKRLRVIERKKENREWTQAQNSQLSQQEQMETQQLEAQRRAEESYRLIENINQNFEVFRARRFGLS